MKIFSIALLLAGSFAFAPAIAAQTSPAVSEIDAPILVDAQPQEPLPYLFFQQAQPAPLQPVMAETGRGQFELQTIEDRYRTEIQSLAENRGQFVHCKLKNGKILTGTLRNAGDKAFVIRTNALGEGTDVEYTNLAESPRAVPAVGTRIKQGAQLAGFVAFVVIFFIPLALTGVIPSC